MGGRGNLSPTDDKSPVRGYPNRARGCGNEKRRETSFYFTIKDTHYCAIFELIFPHYYAKMV